VTSPVTGPATEPARVLIGIGNPYRRDDGVGPALIEALQPAGLPGVRLAAADGEPTALISAWQDADLAVVVDAVLCERPQPGRVHRTVWAPGQQGAGPLAAPGGPGSQVRAAASTHGPGVPDAVRLAEVLGAIPGRLVVFAVEAADLGFGPGLSEAVAASLPRLTRSVRAEFGL
jgi:hydrogenase maturation protease